MKTELPIEEIRAFAEMAANQLNPPNIEKRWHLSDKYADNCWMAQIEDGDGHAISFARGRSGNRRLAINGDYPTNPTDYKHQREEEGIPDAPCITVSIDKDPYQICRDISRRFMPFYLMLWDFLKKKLESEKKAKGNHRQVVEELAALAGNSGEVYKPQSGGENYVHLRGPDDTYYGDVKVNYYGTDAKVELNSVPLDVVKRILAVLPQKNEKGS